MEEAYASLSEAESIELERTQGRKRLRHEPNWERNKQKRRKDMGKAYETYHGKGEPRECGQKEISLHILQMHIWMYC